MLRLHFRFLMGFMVALFLWLLVFMVFMFLLVLVFLVFVSIGFCLISLQKSITLVLKLLLDIDISLM